MDFKQIEVFINIMRYGTFSEAAKRLDMTPSQIRASMDALEQETGAQLFHVSSDEQSGEIQMTTAGQRFFRGTMNIVSAMEQTLRAVEESAPANLIRIAAHPVPGAAYLPGFIAAYRLKHPEIRFQMDVLDAEQAAKEISEGHYDMGVVHPLPSVDMFMMESHCVWTDRLCAITPDTPPYRELPPVIPFSALEKLPLIIPRPVLPTDPSLENLLTAAPSPGKPALMDLSANPPMLTSNHTGAMIQMTADGFGAALVPISLARQAAGVRILELEGIESLPRFHTDYYAIYPRAEYRLPHLAAFLDLMPPVEPVTLP
jgi:DNA-binding transcriptional LysR family regulator